MPLSGLSPGRINPYEINDLAKGAEYVIGDPFY